MYTKVKEALGATDNSSKNLGSNTSLAWLTLMIIGNAISISNGQEDMKINEEGLDWNKVFESVGKEFKNNTK